MAARAVLCPMAARCSPVSPVVTGATRWGIPFRPPTQQRRGIALPRVEPTRFRAPRQSIPFRIRTFLWQWRWRLLALLALLVGLWAIYCSSPVVRRACRCARRNVAAVRLGVRMLWRARRYLQSDRSSLHHLVHEDNARDIRDFIERHGAGTVYCQLLQLIALASPHSPLFSIEGGLDPLLYSTYVQPLTPVLHDDQAIAEAMDPEDVARALSPPGTGTGLRVTSYNDVPFACNPVAQYHHCQLSSGAPAVVVLRHRRSSPFVAADLCTLKALASLADWAGDTSRYSSLVCCLTRLSQAEGDFAENRRTLHRLHCLFRRSWRVVVPRPVDPCCSDDVLLLQLPAIPTAPLTHIAEIQALGCSAAKVGAALEELTRCTLSHGLLPYGPLSGAGVGALGDTLLCSRRGVVVLSGAAFRAADPQQAWELQDALLQALPVVAQWRWSTTAGLGYSEHAEVNIMHALMRNGDERTLPLFFGLQTSLYAQKQFGRTDSSALQFFSSGLLWGSARAAFSRRRYPSFLPSVLLAAYLALLWLPSAWLSLLWTSASYRLAGIRQAVLSLFQPAIPLSMPLVRKRKQ